MVVRSRRGVGEEGWRPRVRERRESRREIPDVRRARVVALMAVWRRAVGKSDGVRGGDGRLFVSSR